MISGLRRRWRTLSRLRFYRKARNLRSEDAPIHRHLRYLLFDPELHNFTYELGNSDELGAFLAEALGRDHRTMTGYVREPYDDAMLRRDLAARARWRFSSKTTLHYGRRLGWYAMIRAERPSLVVETGIAAGLGSALLLSALARNREEGGPDGRLLSFDPDPSAGWLVPDRLRSRWKPVRETSEAALGRELAGRQVGMLIHDSEHTYELEQFEFRSALAHAARPLLLVSDNAHDSSALSDLAVELDAPYRFWAEQPKDHWYPGAGIGVVRHEVDLLVKRAP